MESAIYWDTSVLLKLYADEPDSDDFREKLCVQQEQVAISFLHRVELLNALAAKEQRGEIAEGQAELLFASFQKHRGEGRFLEIPWGEDVESAAQEVLVTCGRHAPPVPLRSLDGFHLGAIRAAGIRKVITADIRFRAAAECLGLDLC